MNTALAQPLTASLMEQVLIGGDLSKLAPADRVMYYKKVCESVGLNPLTKPFEYITLNGKLTLYAKRDASDQLRKINGVSILIVSREVVEGCYVVTAQATDRTGRHDESIGAVPIDNLRGEARSNAMMKAETKAKRRVTLSVCGLGLLDETEVDSIPGAYPGPITPTAGVLGGLTAKRQEVINETAAQMRDMLSQNNVFDAYSLYETSDFDADEKVALWSLLDSKQRSALKRLMETERAAQDGKISPAQKKRLEARIKELGLERVDVKEECVRRFGKEHFADLTKDEYEAIDNQLDVAQAATSDPKAAAAQVPERAGDGSPSSLATPASAAAPTDAQIIAQISVCVGNAEWNEARDLARSIRDEARRTKVIARIGTKESEVAIP